MPATRAVRVTCWIKEVGCPGLDEFFWGRLGMVNITRPEVRGF